ncbi:hypothetical protein CISIN_1g034331mg [Citrus sinensis]|uniref:Uncharacterized protein n=1 Tax=Citrus sinensis TaxID=2711 RepID=A0A067EK34_CITSI|nr:hypothetical protein CISIN_1g034331mg [Citrus sinensis]
MQYCQYYVHISCILVSTKMTQLLSTIHKQNVEWRYYTRNNMNKTFCKLVFFADYLSLFFSSNTSQISFLTKRIILIEIKIRKPFPQSFTSNNALAFRI